MVSNFLFSVVYFSCFSYLFQFYKTVHPSQIQREQTGYKGNRNNFREEECQIGGGIFLFFELGHIPSRTQCRKNVMKIFQFEL